MVTAIELAEMVLAAYRVHRMPVILSIWGRSECGITNCNLMQDTPSAGTLTEHGDTVWIPTKQMDVVLDPAQCESLVM